MHTSGPSERARIVAVVLSILGLIIHNLAEFPATILVAPETLVPVAITAALGWWLLRSPDRTMYRVAGAWALVMLVVGGLSVLPLAVLPFEPEQSVGHYIAHLVYAAGQVPLLWVAWRGLTSE